MIRERKGEGLKRCIMKPTIVSWNVIWLNVIDKRLRIRGGCCMFIRDEIGKYFLEVV